MFLLLKVDALNVHFFGAYLIKKRFHIPSRKIFRGLILQKKIYIRQKSVHSAHLLLKVPFLYFQKLHIWVYLKLHLQMYTLIRQMYTFESQVSKTIANLLQV